MPRDAVTVVKLNPAGHEVARYSAVVMDEACPKGWIAVEARWVIKQVEIAGLVFEPGDTLIEYFSSADWFNAFRIIAPDGSVRGVYGNVTYPVSIDAGESGAVITWHDLYLDVLRLGNGKVILCDEDELIESGLERSDPELFARIRSTAGVMIERAESGLFPFHMPIV